MNIGYIAHAIDSNSCDHELLTLSIDVPTRDIPQGMEYRYKPTRKQFFTHKLKDKNTKKAYQKALSKKSESIIKQMKALRDSHQSGHISKQTLANDTNKIFTSYVQEAAESHLGEVHPMVPIRPPQGSKENKPPPNEDPHTTQLMKNVKEAFNTANKLIDNMAPHDEIEQAFNKLARARLNLKTHKRSFQDQQLHQFVNTGNLNFSLTGPTLNEAWHCLQQAASKIKRKSSSLPKLMYTNTLDLIDKSRWLASPLPAATAALSARAWGQFRYALGHHKRNHPLSPFDEIEALKVEQQTVHLHNMTAATQDAQVDQDTTQTS